MIARDSIIPREDEIAPFFQPIVSIQTQRIMGYEVLGRKLGRGGVSSLGPFFKDPAIPDDVHIAIDRVLRERAFAKLAQSDIDCQLFVNLKPSWIYRVYHETGRLPTLQLLEKHGIAPHRLVVEVTEEDFSGNLHELKEVLEIYRGQGCTIAIDDVGSGFSSLDRIAMIQPKIMKIDLNILKKSAHHDGYRALLRSFSVVAEQMGASLLVEGVETRKELQMALHAGARYVQGFLLSPAVPEFLGERHFADLLQQEIADFRDGEMAKHRRLLSVEMSLNRLVSRSVDIGRADDADDTIEAFLPSVMDNGIRLYICREDGTQLSSNFYRGENGVWAKDSLFRGANWVWRPYFIPNILTMKNQRIGMLSQAYTDLDTSSLIQTYSCPIGDGLYLFIDMSI
ncbi:MAG: EAL domain-containing protein [Paenibacillaceae bacterium]|nr:EAL domain-containing protein [Paenibacillaceae bacterium]